jgi:MFS family permease
MDFTTFYTLRALQGFCLASVQGIGLAFIKDMFFYHEHARKIGIWAAIFLLSPYLGPVFGNFIISSTGDYKLVFWLAFGMCCAEMLLITFFADETWYRRDIPVSEQPVRGIRILRTVGIWQLRIKTGYFLPVSQSVLRQWKIFLKPIIIPSMIY